MHGRGGCGLRGDGFGAADDDGRALVGEELVGKEGGARVIGAGDAAEVDGVVAGIVAVGEPLGIARDRDDVGSDVGGNVGGRHARQCGSELWPAASVATYNVCSIRRSSAVRYGFHTSKMRTARG